MNNHSTSAAEKKTIIPKSDSLFMLTLLFYALLAAVFHSRVQNWLVLALVDLGAALGCLALSRLHARIRNQRMRFWLRTLSVSLILIVIYESSLRLSFIFWNSWHDQMVIDFEQRIFGVQPTAWLQKTYFPALTEWFMFSWLFYFPLYPIFAAILRFRRSESHMEDFFSTIGLNNILCNIGYFLFPVAGPWSYIGNLYSVPLTGYVFAPLGESMRASLLTAGGAMPSGHAAASTIILLFAYRSHRLSFYILLPIVISIYISSVYCRFHYLSDIVAGIIIALLFWGMISLLRKRKRQPGPLFVKS